VSAELILPEPLLSDEVIRHQLERLARRERGRLVADLVARLGPKRLEMAEDVVQDAVIAAMATWPFKGMPDNPGAWLNRVARNKAYDRLRREGRESPFDEPDTAPDEASTDTDTTHGAFFGARIEDPELKLIFLCCQPALAQEDQLMLTLKVVSGFTARDMAQLFLKDPAAIGQRLARAKRKLRALDANADEGGLIDGISRFELVARLPTVLKVMYLMFALGYAPRRGDALILRDVAEEALRLAMLVADARDTGTPEAAALAALLSLQASRFDARIGPTGALVLLRNQNRALWNRALIRRGMAYLVASQSGDALSRYHLEAGIVAAHATTAHFDETDWPGVLSLYTRLEAMTGSPVVAVNACVARAFAGAPEAAFLALEALRAETGAGERGLANHAPYHIARGEVLRMLRRPADAAACFATALECDASAPVIAHLKGRLATCV
jgi:RNA polymerase sigma-70 factor (ECF subfamily)